MAKKMDFVDFVSDLPDEEGQEAEIRAEASDLQGPIPPGVFFKVGGTKVVRIKDIICKKQQ